KRYLSDPFGQFAILAPNWTARGVSSFTWIYLFQGGRHDNNTGLTDFQNRQYSPSLGRWIEADPAGYAAGDSNLYGFIHEDPIAGTDATGLDWGGYVPYKPPPPKPKPFPSVGIPSDAYGVCFVCGTDSGPWQMQWIR